MNARPPSERRRRGGPRGLTIIELAVVIFLAIALIVASFTAVGALFRADLRTDSEKIVAAVRYLYNLSVLNNQAYRLVVDLEGGQYWAEEFDNLEDGPCGAFLIEAGKDHKRKTVKKKERKRVQKGKKAREAAEAEDAPRGNFTQVKNHMVNKRGISKRIKFVGAMSEGKREEVREGEFAIHFFPSGYVEKAFLLLGDDKDGGKIFTVETRPLLGSARIVRDRLRERDLDASDI